MFATAPRGGRDTSSIQSNAYVIRAKYNKDLSWLVATLKKSESSHLFFPYLKSPVFQVGVTNKFSIMAKSIFLYFI